LGWLERRPFPLYL
jgi:hypothetical protein